MREPRLGARGLAPLVAVLALVGLLLGIATAPAAAPAAPSSPLPTAPANPSDVSRVQSLGATPAGHRLAGAQALAIASRSPKVAEALRQYPKAKPEVFLKGPKDWQISWFTPGSGEARKEVAQVKVSDAGGKITEAYNGPQVAWTMARGYPGAFGRKVNSPWVWVPLSVLFLAPFCSLRRRPGMLQLDLLVLVAFGVSVAYFNDANINVSVPIATGLLFYVLLRMLWIGYRRTPDDGVAPTRRLPLWVSPVWLAVALIFLVGFRIGLNVNASNVIDVGYSGVIGADRLVDGTSIYGNFPKDNEHGDTYGPVAYEAYVPFEQALPWSGKWDDLPAAHAAAIAFDLLTLLFLFLAGRRIRGPGLGIVMAYLWAAWPFSLYVLNCNSNDGLVAAFAAATLYVAAKPGARGAVTALAGLTKLGALGLAPLLATHNAPRGKMGATVARFTAAFVATAVVVSLPIILRGESLHTIYDRTIVFQANRDAPFSIWGLHGWTVGEHMWQLTAAFFAVVAAFLPRRRDIVGLAAVAAAVVIGLQLGLNYWFYLYLVWFFPFLAVALLARYRVPRSGVGLSVLALVAVWLVATRHGPFSDASVGDMYVYGSYKDLMVHGLVPYRDFDFEYPPGALLSIRLAGGDVDLLSLMMLGCAVVIQLAAWAAAGPVAGWSMAALPVLAGALVRTHFDLFPTALALVGLALILTRPRRGALELGFVVLALGTMTKLWPAALAAVACCWLLGRGERRAALRAGAIFLLVVLAIGIPFAVLGGFPSKMVQFHVDRPVQIESTAATVLEIAGGSSVTGDPVRHDRFKSNGLDGGAADVVAALSTLALLLSAALILRLAARRPTRDGLVLAALAITLAFVVWSKVLSPQYMVWLLPLAAVAAGYGYRLAPALVAAASLTTQLWFPANYFDVVYQHAWAVVAVGVRNALLLAALVATARALARSPSHAAAAPRSG